MSKKSKFASILLFLISLPILLNAQGTCSFSIKTQVTPVDCRANGAIEITLEGADLGSMQDFMYRAYPNNANPNDYEFITNHIISGLTEGEYIVEVKAFCKLNGVNISLQQTKILVPRTVAYVEPDFTVNPYSGRKSLSCLPSGMIQLQGIVKGKGPYSLKLISYPASYTGQTTILDNVSGLGANYQINNLPAGTYEIEFSDGCGSAIKRTAVVENLSSNYLAAMLNTNYYGSPNAKDGNCGTLAFYKTNPASTSDWYYYVSNASTFYEYAIYYPGQSTNNLSWTSFSNAAGYITFTPQYSLAEMRADKTHLVPQIYVRVKGADCAPTILTPIFADPTLTTSETTVYDGCGIQRITVSFGVGGTSNTTAGISCFPYTWRVVDTNNSTGVEVITTSTTAKYSGARDNLVMYPGHSYVVTATDAQGYVLASYTKTVTNTPIAVASAMSATYPATCNESVILSISSGASLRGGTIQYLTTSGADVVPPIHRTISVPKTFTGSIYPYSSDYTVSSAVPVSTVPTGQILRFLLTDSCGTTKNLTYTGVSRYQYEGNPNIVTNISCGRATISISNLNQLYKAIHTKTNVKTNTAAYMKILTAPAGADVIYSYSSGYIRSSASTDNVQVSKSGTYRFIISSATGFGSTACNMEFDVDIQIPEMTIDDAKTAAYRCPGSQVGTGYMNIKVKDGSGNYKFTLYAQNNTATPLATSTTGVFTSWTATNSDYYTIKIEDLTCGRSMTHNIFVYDLGNATLGWPENNVFVKCLGDRIALYSLALGETGYLWTGPGGWTSTERNPVIPAASLNNSGLYTITVEVPGCGPTATVSYNFTLSIADKVMYWNPKAVDNNWYNTANWLTSTSEQAMAVPAPCTTVHIAGNATKYPNLDMASTPRNQYGYPTCDTIIFHYGAETIYPHYLKYNRAKVQYNFNYFQAYALNIQPASASDHTYPDYAFGENLPSLKRAQWFSISAPLKHITGGDFGLGGYPNFYQRLYNATDPQRGAAAKDSYTLPFNTQNIDLQTTGHAMALWVPDYDPAHVGLGDHKYLQALKGILEMPYFLNPQIMAQRPLNKYNVADSTSTFQYYLDLSPTLAPINKWDTYQRGYQAFRFVFENNRDTVSVYNVDGVDVAGFKLYIPTTSANNSTRNVMIGNPLMCHINFDKIYELNSTVIEDRYMVTEGASEVFLNYRMNGTSNELPNQIAPLQGFIVTLKETPSRNYLLLPFEGTHSVITPSITGISLPKPRSTKTESNTGWLNIVASTPPKTGISATTDNVKTRATLLINHSVSNIPKVIFADGLETKAEVYLIGSDGYLNTEQVEHGFPDVVKFGLESKFENNISLQFSKEESGVIDKVILVDKYLSTTKDITNNEPYVFKHRVNLNNGIDNDRFELRLSYKASSISQDSNAPVIIQATRTKFMVESTDFLNTVSLFDALGKPIITKNNLNTTEFTEDVTLLPGVYIASVTLVNQNRVITQKIVVR